MEAARLDGGDPPTPHRPLGGGTATTQRCSRQEVPPGFGVARVMVTLVGREGAGLSLEGEGSPGRKWTEEGGGKEPHLAVSSCLLF